jgi:Ser/Thr protein kinase RdoA (MazF antagonist)
VAAKHAADELRRLDEPAKDTRLARLLHADTQPTNVMVAAETLEYRALIDWGDARWAALAPPATAGSPAS